MRRVSLGLGLFVAVIVAACSRNPGGAPDTDPDRQDRSGSATLTSASFTTKESTVDRITAARCAREVTCSNIGPDKHYPSNDKCVAEMKARLDADLGPNDCPDGIDARQVDECLDAIRKESCSNPMSMVARLAECRTSSLCVKPYGRPLF